MTTSDVSIERDLPENVVQGGIFSTLGGKSVLRLVYKEFSAFYKGIVTGMKVIEKIPYFLFADDGVLPVGDLSEIPTIGSHFWHCAKKWGLSPNDKSLLKKWSYQCEIE